MSEAEVPAVEPAVVEVPETELIGGLGDMVARKEAHANHAVPQEEEVPKEAAIKIGDKEFATQKEAFDYANGQIDDMERERQITNAYQQGILDVQGQAPVQQNVTPVPVPQATEDFDQKFYENPQKYLNEHADKIRTQTRDEIMKEVNQQNKRTELWTEFYSKFPDLANKKDLVETTLNANWDVLGTMQDAQKAMDMLGGKVRTRLTQFAEDLLPKQELPNTQGDASPGGQMNVTPKKSEDKPVDFISQLNQANSKRFNRTTGSV